jgi:tetratricopeptide (TPR) repeat protein
LAHRFRRKIEGLVPDQGQREGHSLADALRAAGVETAVAEHAARVRDRLRLARFGPEGATDADELAAEVREVLKVLTVQTAPPGGVPMKAALLLALFLGGPGQATAQAPEYLYEAGAYRAAADSFAKRAQAEPNVPDHWYNLGNTLEQLEQPVAARAAWLRAARLIPRAGDVRRALERQPAPDPISGRLTRVFWLTPAEMFLAAAALWLVGWLILGASSRLRFALPILIVAVGAGAYGMRLQQGYETQVALVREPSVALLEAPYAAAPPIRELGEGVALQVVRVRGGWLLVRRGSQQGWVSVNNVEVI